MTGSSRWDRWFLAMGFPCPCGLSVLARRDDPEGTFGTRSSRTGISGSDSVLAMAEPVPSLGLCRWNGGTNLIPREFAFCWTCVYPLQLDGSLDGLLPPLWRRKNGTRPFILIGRVPPGGSTSDSGATQGPGEVLFIFWALARSTKTGLVLSDFCPALHLSPSRDTDWRSSWRPTQLSPRTRTMRGAARAGAVAKEP